MRKYALIVGINKYRDPLISDLPYAAKDAEGMGRCLEEDCGFEDVKVLDSQEGRGAVTSSDIGRELAKIADEINPADTFVFYFAGHGVRSRGQSRFLTSDDTRRVMEFSLGYDQLRSGLAEVKCAQQVLIFDCCRSDPQHSRSGGHDLATGEFVRDIKTLAGIDGGGASTTCVMFSCEVGQCAYDWPAKEHGVFTHFLLEGLSEKGWSEGQLIIQDVAAYVREGVTEWSKRQDRQQTPWSTLSGQIGPVVIAEKQGKDGGAGTDEKLADKEKARQATDKAIEELTEKLEAARKEIEELKSEKPAEVESQSSYPTWDPGPQEWLKQFNQVSQAISQAEEAVDDLTEIRTRIEDEDYHEVEEKDLLEDLERARQQAEEEVAEAVGCAEEVRQQGAAIAAAVRRARQEGRGRNPPEVGYLIVGLSLCAALWLFSRLNWPCVLLALCILILVYAVYFAPRIANLRTKNRQDSKKPPQEGEFSQPQNFPTLCHLTPSSAKILRSAFIQHYNPYVRLLAAGHKGKDREPRIHASRGLSMAHSAFKRLKSSTREAALANMRGVEGIGGMALKEFARESNGEAALFLYLVDLRLGVLSGVWERTAADRKALKEKAEQTRNSSRTVRSDSNPSSAEDEWTTCLGCGCAVVIVGVPFYYWIWPAIVWLMDW